MQSPAAAIVWEFRQRHRLGLFGLIAYLIVLGAIKLVIVTQGQVIKIDTPQGFAFVVVIPMTATLVYFLAVFSFGLAGDLAARHSMYPARLFRLPVTTAALAGWPMLFGTISVAVLWAATRLFTLWPPEIEVPVIWPALLAAALLAWTQAFIWLPYPLPGLRPIAAVFWLAAMDAIVMAALYSHAHEPLMVAIIAPQIPLAYLVAKYAVARGRRGDVPDWRESFSWLAPIARLLLSKREHFASPVSAQVWFEWKQGGRSLPGWMAILLPIELALLLVSGDVPLLVFEILAGVLVTPPFMATFAAASVRTSNAASRDSYGMTPFTATRPLCTAELVSAKLRVMAWSTALTWLLVLVAIPVALKLTGRMPVVIERARWLADGVGTPRAIVLVLLVLAGLVAATWKQLVQSLYIGLTGRAWLIKGSVFVVLSLLFLIGPVVQLIVEHKRLQGALWDALPAILALIVLAKMIGGTLVVVRLFYRRDLLSDRALVTAAACWCAVVLSFYGVLVWFMDTPFFPHYVLVLIAIVAVPLTRVSAAPLALAWNRHR